jgi:hypothetical protein
VFRQLARITEPVSKLDSIRVRRREHPGEDIPDGHGFTQPWPAGPKDKRRDQVIYHSYKADRARRTLHGIDEQVAKAPKAVAGAGQAEPVHRPGRRDEKRQP